jgi:tRNA_anti-like
VALKPCIECKKEISGEANPCPHCGKKSPHGMSKLMKYGGGAVGALIIIAAIAPARKTREEPSPKPTETTVAPSTSQTTAPKAPPDAPPKATPELTVDARKLWSDYEANEVAADARYKDKILRVTGVVASIDKDFLDNIIIHLRSPNEFMNTMAKLEESETSKAAALSKGTKVELLCKCKGRLLGSPNLDDCTVNN